MEMAACLPLRVTVGPFSKHTYEAHTLMGAEKEAHIHSYGYPLSNVEVDRILTYSDIKTIL